MDGNSRPRGLVRFFLRFPIFLYRIGLGWLFGDRLVLLTHRGRQSGRQRQVVVETVRIERATRTVYILSGWGEQSDWVRNIQRTPAVVVQLGLRRWLAIAVRLDAAETERELLEYGRRRPVALAALAKRYQIALPEESSIGGNYRPLAHRIPLFALQAQSQ